MPIQLLPFPEWLPDQPDYNNPGSSYMLNVMPLTPQSYGPVAAFSAYTTTGLTLRCQGAYSAIDSTNTVSLFAADKQDLYRLQSGTSFSTVSKAGPHPYNCPADNFWSFAQFGQNIYAANINDPMQVMSMAGASFADLGGGSPKAKYLAVVRDFLVAGWTNDGTAEPQRVWWSAINNPASWPTPGTASALQVQSDYQDIAGTQGWLQGIVPDLGYADAAVFFERAVYRMQYVGSPLIFQFAAAEGVRGTPAPHSLVQLGSIVYYLGEDGFYAFDGAQSQPIGVNKVDRWFFGRVDKNQFARIQGAVDPMNKLIIWVFPDGTASSGNPNNGLIYNVPLNRWTWVPGAGSIEYIRRILSIGYTLEGLSAIYPVLETVPAPLDSSLWTGGKMILGAFDTSHRLGFFSGSTLAATLQTSEQQINDAGRIVARSLRPIVEGATNLTATFGHRERVMDSVVWTGNASINADGLCPIYASGRYTRGQITIPAGVNWTHAQGMEVEFEQSGTR